MHLCRMSLYQHQEILSNGTTAAQPCTIPRIWATPGTCLCCKMARFFTWNSNYVTQDILRRIMEDYFGYDVHLVMNITDIDDKVHMSPSCVIFTLNCIL